MDTKILENAGLSKGEIEVYLTLLKIGSSRVSKISQDTGRHRTNIYDTLKKLQEKGLASCTIKDNAQFYSASDPDKILSYFTEREKDIRSILPELKSYTSMSRSESVVEIYQGKEGLKLMFEDILKEGKDYLVFEEEGYIQKVLPQYVPQINNRLNDAKIRVKVLTKDPSKISKRSLMKIRSFPHFISFPAATLVYGNKVAILVWDEPYHAILIRSKQVADSYRNFFNLLWKEAKGE